MDVGGTMKIEIVKNPSMTVQEIIHSGKYIGAITGNTKFILVCMDAGGWGFSKPSNCDNTTWISNKHFIELIKEAISLQAEIHVFKTEKEILRADTGDKRQLDRMER